MGNNIQFYKYEITFLCGITLRSTPVTLALSYMYYFNSISVQQWGTIFNTIFNAKFAQMFKIVLESDVLKSGHAFVNFKYMYPLECLY